MPSFGTLKADTLTHSTAGSLDTNFVVEGSSKAWVLYNGDTSGGATLDSFNMSSVTDSATGEFRTNFSSSMDNANYCPVGMNRTYHVNSSSSDDKTTSGELHQTFYVSNTAGARTSHDSSRASVSYSGDLA